MEERSSQSLHKTVALLKDVITRLESGDIIERPKSFDEVAELCQAQARKDHQRRVLCEYQQAVRQQVEEVTERTGINFDHHRYFTQGGIRWPGECKSCGRPNYGNEFCADCQAMRCE